MINCSKDCPLLIVVTPVRNEAWVLDAFLTCVSSWADRIIVADQHSTDGSREIASKYDKVVVVDNDSPEMNQAAARLRLFEEVDKIQGDKIVFSLDADEFLSKGFDQTEGWKRILDSSPNELFCFKWLNLYGDYHTVSNDSGYKEWCCHFAPDTRISDLYCQCESKSIHEMRMPCLPLGQVSYIEIPDIQFVHLAQLNLVRQRNKEVFYQVSTIAKLKKRISSVSIFRDYHQISDKVVSPTQTVELYALGSGENMANKVKLGDFGQYYIDEILAIFQRDGLDKYLKLDIWDNPYLKDAGIGPKIPMKYRMLHSYLRKTQRYSNRLLIRVIDKLLKYIC